MQNKNNNEINMTATGDAHQYGKTVFDIINSNKQLLDSFNSTESGFNSFDDALDRVRASAQSTVGTLRSVVESVNSNFKISFIDDIQSEIDRLHVVYDKTRADEEKRYKQRVDKYNKQLEQKQAYEAEVARVTANNQAFTDVNNRIVDAVSNGIGISKDQFLDISNQFNYIKKLDNDDNLDNYEANIEARNTILSNLEATYGDSIHEFFENMFDGAEEDISSFDFESILQYIFDQVNQQIRTSFQALADEGFKMESMPEKPKGIDNIRIPEESMIASTRVSKRIQELEMNLAQLVSGSAKSISAISAADIKSASRIENKQREHDAKQQLQDDESERRRERQAKEHALRQQQRQESEALRREEQQKSAALKQQQQEESAAAKLRQQQESAAAKIKQQQESAAIKQQQQQESAAIKLKQQQESAALKQQSSAEAAALRLETQERLGDLRNQQSAENRQSQLDYKQEEYKLALKYRAAQLQLTEWARVQRNLTNSTIQLNNMMTRNISGVTGNIVSTVTGSRLLGRISGRLMEDAISKNILRHSSTSNDTNTNSNDTNTNSVPTLPSASSDDSSNDTNTNSNDNQTQTQQSKKFRGVVPFAIDKLKDVDMSKIYESLKSHPEAIIHFLKIAGGITAVVLALRAMDKAGKQGNQTLHSMTRSYKELGDGADYALMYAKRLNDDLGQGLDVTLEKLAKVSTQLRSIGMNTLQSTNAAVTSEGLSQRIAFAWQIEDVDQVREAFMDAMSGGSGLEFTGVNTSDAVMAAWLAQTKGVNMYSVAISEAQMQAYRLEKIVQDLGRVSTTTGETLTTLNIDLDSTWAKNQQMAGQLDETRKKWEALMVPIYKVGVAIKSWIVDALYNASNAILWLLGKETLKLSEDLKVDESALSSVQDLNAEYSQVGETIKAAKAQLLSFDELVSLNAVQTLAPSDSLDFANNADLTGLGTTLQDAIDYGVQGSEKLKLNIENADIAMAGSVNKLKEIWDSMSDEEKRQHWIDFGIRLSELGYSEEDFPDWLKEFDEGKQYDIWTRINAAMRSDDPEELKELLKELNDQGIHEFDALIQAAIQYKEGGGTAKSLGDMILEQKHEILLEVGVKLALGALAGTIIGAIIGGPVGAIVGLGAGLLIEAIFNWSEIRSKWGEFWSWLTEGFNNVIGWISDGLASIGSWISGLTSFGEKVHYDWQDKNHRATVVEGSNIRGFATGGVALSPMVAQVAEGGYPEMIQPLGGPVAEGFYNSVADAVASKMQSAPSNTTINVTIPISNMFASNYELKQLSETMADYLAEALRNRGELTLGTVN